MLDKRKTFAIAKIEPYGEFYWTYKKSRIVYLLACDKAIHSLI